MANYSIKLLNIIDSINDTKSSGTSEGFLFKYFDETLLISVHHFKPIITTLINTTEKALLRTKKNVFWNELMIFNNPDKKYTLNTKVIKKYRTRFLDKSSPINIFINNKKETFASECYNILKNSPCQKSYYLHFLISDEKDLINTLIPKYKGLSGSPVFDNDENLIGIFCKVKLSDNKLYGLVLPVIYLIKTLEKIDNENLYSLNVDINSINKIGKYEIKQYVHDVLPKIYYLPINDEIPLDIYYNLEGDNHKSIKCKEKCGGLTSFEYKKYIKYDITNKIIKKDNKFKLNTGLLTYLVSNGMDSEYNKILDEYIKKYDSLKDIWISFDTNTQISI
jgi:hypothetical protein